MINYRKITKNVKTKLIYRIERKFHNVSSCENDHKLLFRHKALAAPSIDKMEKQVVIEVISKLCNQVPLLSLSRWRTFTLLEI